YSNIVTIKLKEGNNILTMFPNPFTDYIALKVYAQQKTLFRITIYDGSGRALMKQRNDLHPGDNRIIVSGLQSLSKGTYILKTEDGKQTLQYKITGCRCNYFYQDKKTAGSHLKILHTISHKKFYTILLTKKQ
ncbi:MAG: T9SS type A sorting domain-containing protein, partial [Chitinophagales bacterium]